MNIENNKINLNEFKENIYSQSGEDGITKKILENLSIEKSNEFVEFGAHDGKTNSNCFNLLKNNGYQGIFIEPDKKRFQKLEFNTKNYKSKNINSYVFEKGNLMLDRILSKEKISQNFDILSIDIDGHDYQIFRSISLYSPKIVIIEYNPTIPNDIEYIQPDNIKVRHGSSAKSIINLAKEKEYVPVAITDTNLFFLSNNIFKTNNFLLLDLNKERDDSDTKISVFYGYNGELLFTQKQINLRWHFLKFDFSRYQFIPKYLRFPLEDYSLFQKILYKIFKTFVKIRNKILFILKKI